MFQIRRRQLAQGFDGTGDQPVRIERAGVAGGLGDGIVDALACPVRLALVAKLAQGAQLPLPGQRGWGAGAIICQYPGFLLFQQACQGVALFRAVIRWWVAISLL